MVHSSIIQYEQLGTNAGRLSLNEMGSMLCVQPASAWVRGHWIRDVMFCKTDVLGLTEIMQANWAYRCLVSESDSAAIQTKDSIYIESLCKLPFVFTHSLRIYASRRKCASEKRSGPKSVHQICKTAHHWCTNVHNRVLGQVNLLVFNPFGATGENCR